MPFVLSLIAALSLASIPLVLGWRRAADSASMSRQMGLDAPKKRFDPELFALRTGTGATFNQILFSFLAWVVGGLVAGLFLGIIPGMVFAAAGGLLFYGGLTDRREEFRLQQARDIVTAMGTVETMLAGNATLFTALDYAARNTGVDGVLLLKDLIARLNRVEALEQTAVVQEWVEAWDNPAAEMLGLGLTASFQQHLPVADLIKNLRATLSEVVGILSRARAASQGIAWQARFLAIFPPMVLVFMSLLTPEAGRMYATQPWYLLPVLVGSSLSYWLSMRSIRNGLSIDVTVGMKKGQQGIIAVDKMGREL
jgi:Flp pilus assembly protein TadB